MPILADLLGSAAIPDQLYPFSAATSPPSNLWWLQSASDPPWLSNSGPAFAPPFSQAEDAATRASKGGLLGPIFGDGASSSAVSEGGILQGAFPARRQDMLRMLNAGGLASPLNADARPATAGAYGTSSSLSTPGWQAPDPTRAFAGILNPAARVRAGEQPNPAPRPSLDPTAIEQLPAPTAVAAPAQNDSDAGASDATNGKPSDPDFDRRYAQIIASDPDLSTAVRMSENAGDKTFKGWLANVLHNLQHNPAEALGAIRQAAFDNQMRAETHQSGADIIANLAIRKAADRLDSLNPGQGVAQAHYQGYRAAADYSQDQRQIFYTIASNPNLSLSEKLDRLAKEGLFDVALAGSLAHFGGFFVRPPVPGTVRGPFDRPGGGAGSRLPRTSPLGAALDVGRRSNADSVAQAIRAEARRRTPGVVSGNGAEIAERWLADMDAPVPTQVAALLRGRRVANFKQFRELFWQTVVSIPELAAQFSPQNRGSMILGLAPTAPQAQQVGQLRQFRLHHSREIADGGPVYDFDNIRIVSPLRHHQIHYGNSP